MPRRSIVIGINRALQSVRGLTLLVSAVLLILVASARTPGAWSRVESGTLAWLHSVYLLDEKNGWAVGSGGTFLITTDGGLSWKQIGRITKDTLRDVHFVDDRRGWLLCERERFSSGTQALSYLLRTEDGGRSWERFDLDSGSSRLLRLVFSKEGNGFAIGEGGAIWQLLDDGVTWSRRELPTRFLILSGQFLRGRQTILVGGGGTVLLSKGDDEWSKFDSLPGTKERINSVFFLDENLGWLAGAGGRIFSTKDGGRTWHSQDSRLKDSLYDIYFIDTERGFAVGDAGRIIETSDGGRTWSVYVTGVRGVFERLSFSGKTGIAVGHGGLIFRFRQSE